MRLPAGFVITLTMLCIDFMGDAPGHALDPRALME